MGFRGEGIPRGEAGWAAIAGRPLPGANHTCPTQATQMGLVVPTNMAMCLT